MLINTKRCQVRAFEASDLDNFMVYRNNEDWMKYQGFKGLTKESYREKLIVETDFIKGAQLAVYSNIETCLIGDLYLQEEADHFWIGYTISPQYARRGYAYEVVDAVINYLKLKGIRKVCSGVHPENLASIKLLKKLGFVYVSFDEGDDIYELTFKK